MKTRNFKSPAKMNLYLRVLNKRKDGFHNLDSSFQLIDLFDQIEITNIDTNEIEIECNPNIIKTKNNIVYAAVNILRERYKADKGIRIKIKKNIPIGAGLGGGSSNAATVLIALNQIWDLKIQIHDLMEIGKTLGADVPFFIKGENAHVSGIGDILTKKESDKAKYILICPDISISTKDMFLCLDRKEDYSDDKKEFIQNSFLQPVCEKYNDIDLFYENNKKSFDICLTGTGSTMFIRYKDSDELKKIFKIIPTNWRFFLAEPLQYSPLKGV